MEINTDFNSPIEALDYLVEMQRQQIADLEHEYRTKRGDFQIECVRKAFYQFMPDANDAYLDYAARKQQAEWLRQEIEGEKGTLVSLLAFRDHRLAEGGLVSDMNARYQLFPALQENGR